MIRICNRISNIKSIMKCSLYVVAPNGFQLGEVGDLEALTFNLALMFIRNPNVQLRTEPAITPNRC
jgi:hypothetical protein